MLDKYNLTEKEVDKLVKSMVILIDSREKQNQHITKTFDHYKIRYEKTALKYGDYSFYLPANPEFGIPKDLYFTKDCTIERKADLNELSQSFTKHRANIERELLSMPDHKVLIVEDNNYSDLVNHNYDTDYHEATFLRSLHRLWHRYRCPFFFVTKREAPLFIKYFFECYLREIFR